VSQLLNERVDLIIDQSVVEPTLTALISRGREANRFAASSEGMAAIVV
jgi:hypothetical protein